jgi:hypothetical protein
MQAIAIRDSLRADEGLRAQLRGRFVLHRGFTGWRPRG